MALIADTKIHLESGHTDSPGYYNPGDVLPSDLDEATALEFLKYGSATEDERQDLGEGPTGDVTKIKAFVTLEKYEGDDADARAFDDSIDPDEVLTWEDNLLLIGGASALWDGINGRAVTAFTNANAHLGVGDSSTAAADTQTDLQAASNKLRKAMDATYPQHSDSTGTAGSKTITFRSTYATGDANFAWNEWGTFNASSAGRMLNRKVESMGTKTSAASWVLTVTLTLA